MSKFTYILLFILCLTFNANAYNLSGEWNGTRYQYDETKTKYIAEFSYKYDLKQEGNKVTGTTYIESQAGNYAKVALRGFIEGDQFYFEEYKIIEAQRAEGYLWCFKKGVLTISEENGQIELKGATESFDELYGFQCTGGITHVFKESSEMSEEEVKDLADNKSKEGVSVYPNPFIKNTYIKFYNDKNQKVYVDVVDIQGRVVSVLEDKELEKGTHTYEYSPKEGDNSSYYYIRITMGDKQITKSIQKAQGIGGLR